MELSRIWLDGEENMDGLRMIHGYHQMRMMGYVCSIWIDGGEMFHDLSSLGSGVRVRLELGIPVPK